MNRHEIPVVTVDGPSGVGKGTVSQRLAKQLGWHWFDSGASYRIVAWACDHYSVSTEATTAIVQLIQSLQIEFRPSDHDAALETVLVNQQEVTLLIRTEACGVLASKISAIPAVRTALLDMQRAYRQLPGLVTDGRDMGTVVFPEATCKFFLTASAEVRAERRLKQLQRQGIDANLRQIFEDLVARDARDAGRSVA